MKYLHAVLLLGLLALTGSASAQTLLNSFENSTDLGSLFASSTTYYRTTTGVTNGQYALAVTFKPAVWPAVKMVASLPWNWTNYGGVAIDVTNPTNQAQAFGVQVNDDPSADGTNHCRQGTATIAPGQTVSFVAQFSSTSDTIATSMYALPPAYPGMINMGWFKTAPFNIAHIVSWQIFMHQPSAATTLIIDNLRLMPAVNLSTYYAGTVDAYGQFAKLDWTNKLHAFSDFATRRAQEEAAIAAAPTVPGRDSYGGWANGPQLTPQTYFSTTQINGKWWLVDPLGHLFFSIGIVAADDSAQMNDTMVTGRWSMFNWMPAATDPLYPFLHYTTNVLRGPVSAGNAFNFYGANLYRKYGPTYQLKWQQTAVARLQNWGFNTFGNWTQATLYGNGKVPYCVNVEVRGNHATVPSGSDWWAKMPDPYDPQFAADAAAAVNNQHASQLATDPTCIGYFVDNELSWAGTGPTGRYGLAYGALGLDAASSPAKNAILAQLQATYPTIAAFNTAWGTNVASWAALSPPYQAPAAPNAAQMADMSLFVKRYAQKYFQTVHDALKAQDPNHMYLGCRFAQQCPEAIQAAGEICDVVSFNYYGAGVNMTDPKWVDLNGLPKPVIIGEFHFGSLDRGMFSAGLVDAGNQTQRGVMYTSYVQSVVTNPHFVGCHWFQYQDMPVVGRTKDGENFGVGFVDVTDTPYPELVSAARTENTSLYTTRYNQ